MLVDNIVCASTDQQHCSRKAQRAGAAAVAQDILQQCGDDTAVVSDAERVLTACHALAAGRYQVRVTFHF